MLDDIGQYLDEDLGSGQAGLYARVAARWGSPGRVCSRAMTEPLCHQTLQEIERQAFKQMELVGSHWQWRGT